MIGVCTNRQLETEFRGRVSRRVYHLMLRDEAAPIIETDYTKNTLVRRVRHITGDGAYYDPIRHKRTSLAGWWSTQKRIGSLPSEHYDQVAEMVRREFPALAPYVIVKKPSHVRTYENTNTPPPFPVGAAQHIKLLYDRKEFKYFNWAKRQYGIEP